MDRRLLGWLTRGHRALWPVAEQFAAPLSQLVLTPFLLSRLEPQQFALWVIAQSLVVAAPTLSHGRSIALLLVIPRYSGMERDAHAQALVGRTLKVIAAMSVAIAGAVLLGNAILEQLWPHLAIASLYLALVIGYLALVECESALSATLKSYQAFPQTAAVEIAGRSLQVVLVLTLVGDGASASFVVGILIVITALKLALKYAALRRLIGKQVDASASRAETGNDMLHLGWWSWVNVLSGITFYSFDRWAVGYFAGSVALGAYSVCSQLAQLTHSVPAAAAQILIPWASAKRSTLSPATAGEMRRVALLGAILACTPPLLLLAIAPEVLALWISPAFAAEHAELLRHLTIVFLLLTINIPFFDILLGLGYARYAALLSIVAGGAYVASVLVVAPQNSVVMADMKLIYSVISLLFVTKLFQVLKGPTPQ